MGFNWDYKPGLWVPKPLAVRKKRARIGNQVRQLDTVIPSRAFCSGDTVFTLALSMLGFLLLLLYS
jgi:hypothetical protein